MFKELYKNDIVPSLKDKLSYTNNMRIPRITKLCINIGLGKLAEDDKMLKSVAQDLALISGQKPVITRAKKSIAAFKIRKGFPIGCKVTLRGNRLYHFLEKLVYIVLPRENDFKGFSSRQFDSNGNFSLGIKEYISFPEIDYDKVNKILGLDINIITSANNDNDAKALLTLFGFPFVD